MVPDDSHPAPFLVVLGTAQDGGFPQAGCLRECCRPAWSDPRRRRLVACVALVAPDTGRRWLVDATPDIREQLAALDAMCPAEGPAPRLAGILLTHGHMGHVLGLAQLGREAMNASRVPVLAMPRLAEYLAGSGPFARLILDGNIVIRELAADRPIELQPGLVVTPVAVPHRDEVSETVAFRIAGPRSRVLYLPDIDRWPEAEPSLEDLLEEAHVAFVDGTFYVADEVPGRTHSTISHPPIAATLERLASASPELRRRLRFIHLNHSNPCVDPRSPAAGEVTAAGCAIAEEGELWQL